MRDNGGMAGLQHGAREGFLGFPEVRVDEAAGERAEVLGAVDVGEEGLQGWRVGGEVGVPDPVVEPVSRG